MEVHVNVKKEKAAENFLTLFLFRSIYSILNVFFNVFSINMSSI